MSSSQQQAQTSNQTNPWSAQAPYLQQAFGAASSAYGQAQANAGNAPTNFTAQYTPAMLSAFQQQQNYGTQNGAIPGSSSAAGTVLTGAGSNAAGQGLYGLANFTPQGGTQSNINAATAYANNPAISGMVDASMRDAVNTANEVTLPGMARGAAMTGNTNSSTQPVQQGILERGLANTAADISSNLRGNAYQSGLGLAEQNSQANNSNILSALMGLTSGGTSAASAGVNANSGAVGQAGGLYDIANTGTSGLLAGQQAGLANQLQQYQFGQSAPFSGLTDLMNVIGSRSWGGSSNGTTTQTNTPSTLDTIGRVMGGVGQLFG